VRRSRQVPLGEEVLPVSSGGERNFKEEVAGSVKKDPLRAKYLGSRWLQESARTLRPERTLEKVRGVVKQGRPKEVEDGAAALPEGGRLSYRGRVL